MLKPGEFLKKKKKYKSIQKNRDNIKLLKETKDPNLEVKFLVYNRFEKKSVFVTCTRPENFPADYYTCLVYLPGTGLTVGQILNSDDNNWKFLPHYESKTNLYIPEENIIGYVVKEEEYIKK